MTDDEQSAFSDQDQDEILASITEHDLRERSQALDQAQEVYEELAYMTNPKMPCPECSGAGQVAGGSLGDICVRCMGARVIEQPGAAKVEMPPFASLRAAITAYGDALADRALPEGRVVGGDRHGQPIRRNLSLPPAATVPTLAQIQALTAEGERRAKQLAGATPGIVARGELAEPKKSKGLAGEGDLGEYEDGELDQMQDERD